MLEQASSRPGGSLGIQDRSVGQAKNSGILRSAAAAGARPVGIDIATDIVRESVALLAAYRPRFAIADIRALPFRADCFDLVYSIGTIEHSPETELAVAEISGPERPGGRAIVGVPNKLDPSAPRPGDAAQRVGLLRLWDGEVV